MSPEHEDPSQSDPDAGQSIQQQQQQQQQSPAEGHAGQGAESALKQLRVWEQRRASNSGGRSRQRPN